MLGHIGAAVTLDFYADLLDGDLDAVAITPDNAGSESDVPKRCPIAWLLAKQNPHFPDKQREAGALKTGGDGGI